MLFFRSLLLIIVISNTHVTANETLVLYGGEWPPFVSKNLKYYGATPRIITEIFASFGVKVTYQFHPWSRSLEAAKQGVADGTFLWSKLNDREEDFYFSKEPVGYMTFVFFHLKSTPFTWKNYEDLTSWRIGATISYNYSKPFMEGEANGSLNVIRLKSDIQNLKMLLKNRIDIFPHDLIVGYYQIGKNFPKSVTSLFTNNHLPLKEEKGFLLLSSKNIRNVKLMQLFDEEFDKFIKSGKFDKYYHDDMINNIYNQQ